MSFIDNILKGRRKAENTPKPTNEIVINNNPMRFPRNWRCWGGFSHSHKNYAEVVFFQFVKMLGNMFSDVNLEYAIRGGAYQKRFQAFKDWFDKYAFKSWTQLCYQGFIVVGYFKDGNTETFRTLKRSYTTIDADGNIIVQKLPNMADYFVMTSDVFDCFGSSDRRFLDSFLELADKYLNNSDIAIDSNGHLVFCSPEPENGHTSTQLSDTEADEWEKQIKDEAKFSDSFLKAHFSNRPLKIQDVDLTNFDTANFDKLVKVMLVICGHFDLPSNQIPLLESSSTRSLTSGNELLVGDVLKYKTFERVLQLFVDCAKFFNLEINYTINNNPNDIETDITPTL